MITVAICVGHSRSGDRGAVSFDGYSEHAFNTDVAKLVQRALPAQYKGVIFNKYAGNGYAAAMTDVAAQCRAVKAAIAVELHFNSAGPVANGNEWLYWHSSANGRELAAAFETEFTKEFPNSRKRGIKPINAADRGALFLKLTPCPALICEPFFGSNKAESAQYGANKQALANAYAAAIDRYFTK